MNINNLISSAIIQVFLATSIASFAAPVAATNTYDSSVTIDGDKVIIDKGFIKVLEKHPTAEEWSKNYWELLYFIQKGDHQAISVGIDVLMSAQAHRARYDDHFGVKNLAIALSMTSKFHSVICKKDAKVILSISDYYKKYRADYVFDYDAPWTFAWCQ